MNRAELLTQINRIEAQMVAEWGAAGQRQIAEAQELQIALREWQVLPKWRRRLGMLFERVAAALRLRET